jgi:hypothetical protein
MSCVLKSEGPEIHIKGLIPEGCINKITDL